MISVADKRIMCPVCNCYCSLDGACVTCADQSVPKVVQMELEQLRAEVIRLKHRALDAEEARDAATAEMERLKRLALELAGEEDAYQIAIATRDAALERVAELDRAMDRKHVHYSCLVKSAEKWLEDRDKAIEALKDMTNSYNECLTVSRDLQEEGERNWMGTEEDDLESMSDGMVVRIRAGDLRDMLDKKGKDVLETLTVNFDKTLEELKNADLSISQALAENDLRALPEKCNADESKEMPRVIGRLEELRREVTKSLPEPSIVTDLDGDTLTIETLEGTIKHRISEASPPVKLWPKLGMPEDAKAAFVSGVASSLVMDDMEQTYEQIKQIADQLMVKIVVPEEIKEIGSRPPKTQEQAIDECGGCDPVFPPGRTVTRIIDEEVYRASNGLLAPIIEETCRCDRTNGGKLCEPCLAVAMNESLMPEPIGPPLTHKIMKPGTYTEIDFGSIDQLHQHVLCTCDSGSTDGVCQIHKRKGDGTDGK